MIYTEPEEVRAVGGIDQAILDDDAAAALIERAEDIIDGMLGSRPVDPESGRKVNIQDAGIADWQIEKLGRATAYMAVFLFRNPEWEIETRSRSAGSDVPTTDVYGSPVPIVTQLLDDSRLRRLTGRATPNTGRARHGLPYC